jgi:SPP1 gp7 family putative phage head morphogenesis protein
LKTDFDKVDYDTPDYKLLTIMQQNVYAFAGAKTYQELRSLNDLLYDDQGKIVGFGQFRDKIDQYRQQALQISDRYNKQWLQTEYNMAVGQGQMARKWQGFQDNKDLFPNLKYNTAGDARVRPAHVLLNGTVKPIDDPFWDTYYPPVDWGCRCDVTNTDGKVTKGMEGTPVNVTMPGNVGKTGSVFPANHPYFTENGINLKQVMDRVSSFWQQEYVKRSEAILRQFREDHSIQVLKGLDNRTGGFIIRQLKAASLDSQGQEVVNTLFDQGERIMIPASDAASHLAGNLLELNGVDFRIDTLAGNSKESLGKQIAVAMNGSGNVLLNIKGQASKQEIKNGLQGLKDRKGGNAVMILYKDKRVVITKAEIINNNYKALDSLFN